MTPLEAKARYGATHYMPMKDGVTPQMYYKRKTTKVNDGTSVTNWVYLTFANSWHGSFLPSEDQKRLIKIVVPLKNMAHPLEKEFQFAGFTFPKYVWTLPRGDFAKRLERVRNPVTGPYFHAPKPNSRGDTFFYKGADFEPGLRFVGYSDDIQKRIMHSGWYTDEHGDGDKIRGIVYRLPHGRGFLAGWSMGEHMASVLETDTIHEDEQEAAYAGDEAARIAAEKEVERSVRRRETEERVAEIEEQIKEKEGELDELRTELEGLKKTLEDL